MWFLLMRPRFLTVQNSVSAGSAARKLPLIVIGVIIWCLIYLATFKLLVFLRAIEIAGEILTEKLLYLTFFSITGFLIISNVITALSQFYLSKDLPFLISKPIEYRDILNMKTIWTVINSSWMVVSFLPPILLAYGINYHAPFQYYAVAMLALLMLVLITAGAGISCAHLLACLFHAGRSRHMMLGISLLAFIFLYFVARFIAGDGLDMPEDIIKKFLRYRTDLPLLPSTWVARSVLPLLKNKGADIFHTVLLVSNALFSLLVSQQTGIIFFRKNIERLQPSGQIMPGGVLKDFYPGKQLAISYKDSKIFFRDAGQWSQIFIILSLITIYVYNFKSLPIDMLAGISPFMKEIMVLLNLIMAGLILSAVSARFIYTSVSAEGRAFWVIRSAPVELRNFLWLKFFSGMLPVAGVIVPLVFLADFFMKAGWPLTIVSTLSVFILSISVSGLATGMGAISPRFRHENISEVSMTIGAMIFMSVAFLLILITVSLEGWVYYIAVIKKLFDGTWGFLDVALIVSCVVLAFLINTAAFFLPIRLGEKRLRRDMSDIL